MIYILPECQIQVNTSSNIIISLKLPQSGTIIESNKCMLCTVEYSLCLFVAVPATQNNRKFYFEYLIVIIIIFFKVCSLMFGVGLSF